MKDQPLRIFIASIPAGVMISIGCTVSLSVGGGLLICRLTGDAG